jgi:short-chain fatty acids transporter
MRWFQFLTRWSTNLVDRWLPDSFVLVLLLSLFVFGAGVIFEVKSPLEMARAWGEGFWTLLEFSMQMVLILVTGFMLAGTPIVGRMLDRLCRLARTPGQAIVWVTIVSLLANWINWGFGLVVSALYARQLAKVVRGVDYPLLIASAYSGFIVWHGGLSGSVPLSIATPGHFNEKWIGIIPTTETIFSGMNIGIVLSLVVLVPVVNWLMIGHGARSAAVAPALFKDSDAPAEAVNLDRPVDYLEHSRFLCYVVSLIGLAFAYLYFRDKGFSLNLNIMNFLFLILALALHGSAHCFLKSLDKAIRGAAGIVIQFPFYAGLMGMMTFSGLAQDISDFFVAISTARTLPFFTFISAGVLNIFIPSGGAQWAVQSQAVLPAAIELKADFARTAMAVAWGDAWTNLVQPFWALPALAIAGLRAKDIMGYCLVVLIISGFVIGVGFLI